MRLGVCFSWSSSLVAAILLLNAEISMNQSPNHDHDGSDKRSQSEPEPDFNEKQRGFSRERIEQDGPTPATDR